eukprot:m.209202 g.209202  ORF g.209202 m.209202 type:complete len:81 (+) comp22090_c1_seq4:866-1108(+)
MKPYMNNKEKIQPHGKARDATAANNNNNNMYIYKNSNSSSSSSSSTASSSSSSSFCPRFFTLGRGRRGATLDILCSGGGS